MNGNILIVDDDSTALKLLKGILTADGYAVRPFNNGDLALRSIMVEAPELILLDIRMPGMGGFEVCRRIKEDERLKEIPVIFISAASDMEDKVRAFQEGVSTTSLNHFKRKRSSHGLKHISSSVTPFRE